MHIYYKEGPARVGMGAAGDFVKGASRDIDDKLAAQILKKETIKFTEGEMPAVPGKNKTVREEANGSN